MCMCVCVRVNVCVYDPPTRAVTNQKWKLQHNSKRERKRKVYDASVCLYAYVCIVYGLLVLNAAQ